VQRRHDLVVHGFLIAFHPADVSKKREMLRIVKAIGDGDRAVENVVEDVEILLPWPAWQRGVSTVR
jgi:hypothetical protein